MEALVRNSAKIGGPNCTVEIDESKFGKGKYNWGGVVEGQWMIGGICRETDEIFVALCPEDKRDSATLMTVIENHVAEHSTVITDCWKAYSQTEQQNWSCLTAEHSMTFVDPSAEAHTQNIKKTWWKMKTGLPPTCGGNSLLHFAQYLWKRKFSGTDCHTCTTFLRHISELYPGRS